MSRSPMSYRVLAASCLFVVACGGGKPAPAPSSGAGTPPPEEAAAAPPVPGAAADAAPVAGYTDIGIPECDQFARKYLACIDKVPETTRAMVRQAFDQTQMTWAMAAEKPDRRAGLAAACVQQEKATKAGMARYDCEW
jgi:hypothetical protein